MTSAVQLGELRSSSRLLLLLVAASDELDELLDVEPALVVDGRLGEDLLGLLLRELFTPGAEGVFQGFLLAEALALVVHVERARNHILIVGSLCSVAKDGQKRGEVDGSLLVDACGRLIKEVGTESKRVADSRYLRAPRWPCRRAPCRCRAGPARQRWLGYRSSK